MEKSRETSKVGRRSEQTHTSSSRLHMESHGITCAHMMLFYKWSVIFSDLNDTRSYTMHGVYSCDTFSLSHHCAAEIARY